MHSIFTTESVEMIPYQDSGRCDAQTLSHNNSEFQPDTDKKAGFKRSFPASCPLLYRINNPPNLPYMLPIRYTPEYYCQANFVARRIIVPGLPLAQDVSKLSAWMYKSCPSANLHEPPGTLNRRGPGACDLQDFQAGLWNRPMDQKKPHDGSRTGPNPSPD